MRLLLDTHVAIWAVAQLDLLPEHIFATITKNLSEAFVSSISILEISAKYQLGRKDAPPFGGADAVSYFKAVGFQFLPVSPEHSAAVDNLDPHHKDPFDRLLVAQAMVEPMHLVSKDAMFSLYDCPLITW
ncbi:MAG: hypothetical protein JWM58_4469 [Rhizobium sp.]|nr:hypothetical protein [Rhizobium sp.]